MIKTTTDNVNGDDIHNVCADCNNDVSDDDTDILDDD